MFAGKAHRLPTSRRFHYDQMLCDSHGRQFISESEHRQGNGGLARLIFRWIAVSGTALLNVLAFGILVAVALTSN